MCEAIEKMMSESKSKGKAEGKAEGKMSAFAELVKDGLLSVKDAAARMGMTEDEFRAAMQKMA